MATDDATNPKSSQTIGHLVQRIVTSLKPEDGMTDASVTKPNASEPIISAKVSPGSIGMRPGGSGFVAVTESFEVDPKAVLENPMKAMPHSLNGCFEKTFKDRYHPQYGWDGELVGYRLRSSIEPEARQEAVRILAAALEPGPAREIVAQVRRLRGMCAGSEGEGREMQVALYTRELMNVPAAAVELAVAEWIGSSQWWPSYFELKQLVDKHLTLSRQLLEALK